MVKWSTAVLAVSCGLLAASGLLLIWEGLVSEHADSSRWLFLMPGIVLLVLAVLLGVNLAVIVRGARRNPPPG